MRLAAQYAVKHLDHVRRAFLEFNARYDELRDGGLASYHAEFYTPDAVIEHVDNFPSPGKYEGLVIGNDDPAPGIP